MLSSAPFMFEGSANTYAGGTFIEGQPDSSNVAMNPNGATGTVFVTSTSSLGSGNVTIFTAGRLQLDSASNVAGSISMMSTQNALSVLSLGGNFLPAITATNGGVLGLDTIGSYTNNINDLSALGNGRMYLGSIGSQGISSTGTTITSSATFTGTLSPGYDPAANSTVKDTYRLGGGSGGTLTLSGLNALTSTNQLIVGSLAANGSGIVNLTNANNYSGGTTIYNNSTLEGDCPIYRGFVAIRPSHRHRDACRRHDPCQRHHEHHHNRPGCRDDRRQRHARDDDANQHRNQRAPGRVVEHAVGNHTI